MANKKISELDIRTSLSLSDLLAVGDPTTGYLYKITITDLKTLTGAGVISFNGRIGSVSPAEGDYNLTQLGDVIITSASNNQILQYNGSNWVNATINLSGYVPYTGATANVDLGTFDLTADIINLNQLKAIGSGGLNIYSNSGTHIALMGGGGGAGTTFYGGIIGTTASFTSSGSSNTFDITHSSGSGIALNITKGGNGEGLYINKTSGSGNAATIIGTLNATTLVKTGGTSSQFLKADGSVDSSTYLTTSNAASTYVPYTGATADLNTGAFNIYTSSLVVTSGGSGFLAALTADTLNGIGILNLTNAGKNGYLKPTTLGADRTWTLPNATGTIALTSDIPSLSGYVPTSRTLTINGTTYDLSADRSWTISAGISGSGVSGRIPFFDGTSSVTSDSNLTWDNTSKFISTAGVYVFNNTTNAYMLTSNGDNIGSVFNVSALRWGLGYGTSSGTLATAALSWDSTGKVSIGNTNSTYNLDVTGTGRFTGILTLTGSYADLQNTSYIRFSNTGGGTRWGYIQHNGTDIGFNNDISGGKFIFTGGNVGIGTTSPQLNGNSGTFTTIYNASASAWLELATGSTTNGNGGVISFNNTNIAGADKRNAQISGIRDGANNSGALLFLTWNAGSGAERMRITAAGNVGIGITNPTQPFQVYSPISTTSSIFETNSVNSYIALKSTTGLNYIGNVSSAMTFEAGGSEKVRITNASQSELCVGTTSPSNSVSGRGNITIGGTSNVILAFQVGGVGKGYIFHDSTNIYISNGGSGSINVTSGSNGVTLAQGGTSWGSLSDERLKNINSNINNAVNSLMKLRTVNYSWKSDKTNKENLGLIAQDVEKVFPQLIDKNKLNKTDKQIDNTEYLVVRYTELIPVLVKAIQEQQAQIEQLKAQIK
jgi:hypothetical protein